MMPTTPNLQLINGGFTDSNGNVLNLGYLLFELSHDELYSAGPVQVCAGLKVKCQLNSTGNIPSSPAFMVYSNDLLTPSGSEYFVMAYKADGTKAWANEQLWNLSASPSPLDVGTIVPSNPPASGLSGGGSSLLLQTNGTNNSNQALLNIAAGTNVTVSNTSGTTTINASGTSFSTAGNGFFWSFAGVVEAGGQAGTSISLTQGTSAGSATANQVICFQLTLKAAYTVRKISFFSNSAASAKASCAIYDSTGTNKLVDAGTNAFDNSNVSSMQTVTLGSPVVLSPGMYWFACSSTSATPNSAVGSSLTAGAAGYNSFFNVNSTRAGTAANAMSGGAMPSSLGTITAFSSGTFGCPGFFFQV